MAKINTYKTKCKICESPVYYYPVKLLLERKNPLTMDDENNGAETKIVSCSCTGESGGTKHTSDFIFPNDFEKK